MASLGNRYHIHGGQKLIRTIARGCVSCRKITARSTPPTIEQLSIESHSRSRFWQSRRRLRRSHSSEVCSCAKARHRQGICLSFRFFFSQSCPPWTSLRSDSSTQMFHVTTWQTQSDFEWSWHELHRCNRNVGIYVNLSSATSGIAGLRNTCHPWDDIANGSFHLRIFKLVT